MPSDLELLLDGLFPLDGSAPIWMEITTSSPVKHDSLVGDDMMFGGDRAQTKSLLGRHDILYLYNLNLCRIT